MKGGGRESGREREDTGEGGLGARIDLREGGKEVEMKSGISGVFVCMCARGS